MKLLLLSSIICFLFGGFAFSWLDTPKELSEPSWRTLIPGSVLVVGFVGIVIWLALLGIGVR